MEDHTILSIAIHLAASKNRQYRECIFQIYGTLIRFLQQQSLVTRELLSKDAAIGEDFKLMRSDLTEEGYALIKGCLQRWLRSIESGRKPPTDTGLLEKELVQLRKGARGGRGGRP